MKRDCLECELVSLPITIRQHLLAFVYKEKNIGYRLISKSKCNVTVVEEVMILSLTSLLCRAVCLCDFN